MMYLHPWEFDVEQERHSIGLLKSFQHYVNLHSTEWKLDHLLDKFFFTSIRDSMETRSIQAMLNRNPLRMLDEMTLARQERLLAAPNIASNEEMLPGRIRPYKLKPSPITK